MAFEPYADRAVAGTSDAWAAFSSAQQLTATLDAAGRKRRQVLTAGGTTYGVTEYNYDTSGRGQAPGAPDSPASGSGGRLFGRGGHSWQNGENVMTSGDCYRQE